MRTMIHKLILSSFFIVASVFAQQTESSTEQETTTAKDMMKNGAEAITDGAKNAANELSNKFSDWITSALGPWAENNIMGLEAWRYIALFILLLITFIIGRIVRWFFEKQAHKLTAKTKWKADDLIFEAAGKPSSLFIGSLGFIIALSPVIVVMPDLIKNLTYRICGAVAASALIWYCWRLVGVLDHYLKVFAERTDNNLDNALVDVIRKTLRVFILIIGVLLIGQNILDMNISALLASAGVLGLAVAFAAQDTIANFFGSVMLLLDRPFKVGERVKLDGSDGAVETVGFRSTRVRTLDGHLVSLPNKIVADTKIENIGRRPHIKRVGNITITYDTPVAKVEKAVQIIKDILDNHEGMDEEFPPRVSFNDFNDWSLNILFIAWYHPPNYWDFLDWCQDINIKIMKAFEEEGIEFAFPTNTTYLAGDENRDLKVFLGKTDEE